MPKIPSISPLSLSAPILEALDSRLAEDQLLAELAQAAGSAMVATRSHDHDLEDVDLNAQAEGAIPVIRSKKRMPDRDADDTLKSSATKRRKGSAETITTGATKQRLATGKGSGKRLRAEKEARDAIEVVDDKSMSELLKREVVPSAIHRRFGSEEVEADDVLESRHPASINGQEELEDEGDSDDDAPEAVTAAAGFEASRAAAADAGRIAEIQKSALRAKRRELDVRLKAQAEASKLQRHTKLPKKTTASASSPKTRNEAFTSEAQSPPKKSTKKPLPALLPDELLAAKPVVRPPTLPSSVDRQIIFKKTKLLEVEPKSQKDIKRGNRQIRILQVEKSVLPPKSSAASKAIREKWLIGQRGSLSGAAGVPRRKLSSGFVRR